jgi:hypothetical protein
MTDKTRDKRDTFCTKLRCKFLNQGAEKQFIFNSNFQMIAVLILVVLFVSAWFLLTRKHEVDKLPGPRALPLLGNALSFATSREGLLC